MQKFVDRNHDQVRAAGMTPIVWEETLLQWNVSLGSDVVVQTWQSDDAVLQTVQQGHKALVGNYQYWVSTHIALHLIPTYIAALTPPVPRLRPRPMARLLPRHIQPDLLSLRGLLLATQELALDVRLRSPV